EGRAEDQLVLGVGGMHDDDVVEAVAVIEAAQHAHDRCDPAARADEQHLRGQRVGQGEHALDLTEPDDVAGLEFADQVRRDHTVLDERGCEADEPVDRIGIGGERVRPPVEDPVDDHPEPPVLARLVTAPLVGRADEHRCGVAALGDDPFHTAAQFAGRPERVDHFEIVVGPQRCEQVPHRSQQPSPNWVHVWASAAFRHDATLRGHTRRTCEFLADVGSVTAQRRIVSCTTESAFATRRCTMPASTWTAVPGTSDTVSSAVLNEMSPVTVCTRIGAPALWSSIVCPATKDSRTTVAPVTAASFSMRGPLPSPALSSASPSIRVSLPSTCCVLITLPSSWRRSRSRPDASCTS